MTRPRSPSASRRHGAQESTFGPHHRDLHSTLGAHFEEYLTGQSLSTLALIATILLEIFYFIFNPTLRLGPSHLQRLRLLSLVSRGPVTVCIREACGHGAVVSRPESCRATFDRKEGGRTCNH